MIDTINASKYYVENGIEKVDVQCPSCHKTMTFSDKRKTVTPNKSTSFDLHCAHCGTTVGHYSNIR